jgi:hypothetical protein
MRSARPEVDMKRNDVITADDGLPDELGAALACISGAH